MSTVWTTTWRIIGSGLHNLPLRQTALSSQATVIGKGTRAPSQAALFPCSVWNKFTCLTVDTPSPRSKLHFIQEHPKPLTSFTLPQIWKATISGRVNNSNAPVPKPAPTFPKISAPDMRAIFGGSLGQEAGNELLRSLQEQRLSGTLDQGVSASPRDVGKAMAWLRLTFPVDEDGAIIARLEREDIEVEQQRVEAERLGHYKPQQGPQSANRYGQSVLEEIKKRNLQKAAAAEAKAKQQEEAVQNEKELGLLNGTKTSITERPSLREVIKRTESAPWVKRYKDAATMQGMPPEMTKTQRLWPSGAATIVVVVLSILFAQNYIPPSRKARLWPDIPPAAATIAALIGINVAVSFLWRLPPCWKFFNRHFIITAAYPRISSMIGSIFSHQQFYHLASNMLAIWFIGTRLHDDVGRGTFLAIFVSSGVVASYASLSGYVLRNILYTSSLGASGAASGLLGAWCWLHASEKLAVPFIPLEYTQNIPIFTILGIFVVLDIIGMFKHHGIFRTDHVSHLGGYAVGVVAGESIKYRAARRQQAAIERIKKTALIHDAK